MPTPDRRLVQRCAVAHSGLKPDIGLEIAETFAACKALAASGRTRRKHTESKTRTVLANEYHQAAVNRWETILAFRRAR
jgi:hypothetical protein